MFPAKGGMVTSAFAPMVVQDKNQELKKLLIYEAWIYKPINPLKALIILPVVENTGLVVFASQDESGLA